MQSFRLIALVMLAMNTMMKEWTANAGTPDKVSSRLQIHIPPSLFKEEGYDHLEALFGLPPYGGSIAQNLYYADSNLCDPNVDTTVGYPMRDKDEKTGKMKPWPSPFILMVDRGGCTFVKKVRNAQRAGAAGVIIADNTCLCSFGDACFSDPGQECETREPIMADDGSGSDISIPSFLMFKQDADKVKEELMANHVVNLEMSWPLPEPDDRVEYDLWSVPSDNFSKDFLKNFKEFAVALGDKAHFTPHMYIYDGARSGCLGPDGHNMCFNLCTNNGRYCATDPDNDLDKGISGADVVTESLRRLCIWKLYGDANGIGEQWWDYVSEFMHQCDNPDYFNDDDCIEDAYKHAGVDGDEVDRCMNESGGLEGEGTNAFLELELTAQKERGVVVLPTAFVNKVAIRGSLSVSTIFDAICAGYLDRTEPDICKQCMGCPDRLTCIRTEECICGTSQR